MSEATVPVLCYVAGPWAYFTTCPLDRQWGDDWNDAPYEHNAGEPYGWIEYYMEMDGIAPYEITKIAWEGPFITPDYHGPNSPYSVQAINRGDIAWLRAYPWDSNPPPPIHAGTPLPKFCDAIRKAGGDVYLKAKETQHEQEPERD